MEVFRLRPFAAQTTRFSGGHICLAGGRVLVSRGVVQNLKPYTNATLMEP